MTATTATARLVADDSAGVVDIRALLFDFNGVILDDEHLHYELLAELAAAGGIALSRALYDEKYIGYDDRDAMLHIFGDGGKPKSDADIHGLIDLKARRYMETVAARASVFDGWAEFVRGTAPHFRMGICTGALRPEVERVLDVTGARAFIPLVVSAEDVSAGKPDPQGYLQLCRRISETAIAAGDPPIVPAQCLAIEDTVWGVRAAHAAGMWVCGFDGPLGNEEFRRLAHMTIRGWVGADPFDMVATLQQAVLRGRETDV